MLLGPLLGDFTLAKYLVISKTLLILTVVLVTGCGSREQDLDKPTSGFQGKPSTIDQDEASSALGLLVVNGFQSLQQALHTMLSFGDSEIPCRTVRFREGLPIPGTVTPKVRVVMESKCVPPRYANAGIVGTEEFIMENATRIVEKKKSVVRFERGTLTMTDPLQITGRQGNVLLLSTQLRLTLEDPAAGIYRFELKNRWGTPQGHLEASGLVGDWEVSLQGRVRPVGFMEAQSELYDLVTTIQGRMEMRQGASSPSLFEQNGLSVAVSPARVTTSACGYPTADWAGVYSSDLFKADQKGQTELNLTSNATQLTNKSTGHAYNLASCAQGQLTQVLNAIRAIGVQRRARGFSEGTNPAAKPPKIN